ncbi:Hypothetical_protein [Hexamita inflata]|uniref:Hypothetical_protein n=1 Tax=Hexamita inflata TaxID=28002 RepID=A0AA86N9Q8_9EUKA|nr:Hypothetical protein HINF_LOCUS3073 [Hexamita inflata]CAI9928876.1 Hypothetical protein HINF_LOCUS16521 [Hexamita inflata]CAI9942863.1 Hypothetical protein HINF_LOCUS30508 [Hexamita inflata]
MKSKTSLIKKTPNELRDEITALSLKQMENNTIQQLNLSMVSRVINDNLDDQVHQSSEQELKMHKPTSKISENQNKLQHLHKVNTRLMNMNSSDLESSQKQFEMVQKEMKALQRAELTRKFDIMDQKFSSLNIVGKKDSVSDIEIQIQQQNQRQDAIQMQLEKTRMQLDEEFGEDKLLFEAEGQLLQNK